MPVTRRYLCDDCGAEFTKFHVNRNEPFPECPRCSTAEVAQIPGSFAITGNKSRAVDMAQRIMEEDYGQTDFNDNLREGDIAIKPPPPVQGAEAEALTMVMKEMVPEMTPDQAEGVKHFWQTGGAAASGQGLPPDTMLKTAAGFERGGVDPVGLLHQDAKAGGGMKLDVVGRAKLDPSAA